MDTVIFVSNFDEYASESGLRRLFERYGTVIKADVLRSDYGRSYRRGIVWMKNKDNAKRAVAGLNKKMWRGLPLRVGLVCEWEDTSDHEYAWL